ncbi:MAG: nicotinamide riboside transporter PnuC [Pikeienuella sp.]
MTIENDFGEILTSRYFEIFATILGLANVILIIRRSMWNYLFGISMVIAYALLFYGVRLYSDALLQVFFLIIQIFGIYWWLKGRDQSGRVRVIDMPAPLALFSAILAAAGAVALGHVMATRTDADLPYWDACTTVLSMAAQTLMARRYLQSWLVWIVVDVMAIGIYFTKGLYPTAALYTLFLGLAVIGYVQWRRSMNAAPA